MGRNYLLNLHVMQCCTIARGEPHHQLFPFCNCLFYSGSNDFDLWKRGGGGNNARHFFDCCINPPTSVVGLCTCFLSLCWLNYHLFLGDRGFIELCVISIYLQSSIHLWIDISKTCAYYLVGNIRWKAMNLPTCANWHSEPWGYNWCG
jgi:hypothetical protein